MYRGLGQSNGRVSLRCIFFLKNRCKKKAYPQTVVYFVCSPL
jgi:hypothetical protein